MTKGRGTFSAGTINDNWDAPSIVKAFMAFELIWAAFSLIQLVFIFKNLSKLPVSARGPYILLAVVTVFSFIYYLMVGVLTRIRYDYLDVLTANQISVAATGCFTVIAAFQPAVVLWLLQQRGSVMKASKGNALRPFSYRLWKRILDWALVGTLFIIYITFMANNATYVVAIENGTSNRIYNRFLNTSQGLSRAIIALILLSCIDVGVTSIVLFVQAKRAQWNDPVIRRLCQIIVPLFVIYGTLCLTFHIVYSVVVFKTTYSLYGANLAELVLIAMSRVGITTTLVVIMSLAGVQWTPEPMLPSYPESSGQQWSNSKHEETLLASVPQQSYY